MPEFHLNLRNRAATIDFIESNIDLVPQKDQQPYRELAAELKTNIRVPVDRLVETTKNLGAITWPTRRALARFLETTGADMEWKEMMERLEPAAAKQLERLRKSTQAKTIDEALRSSDASVLIKPKQETEIALVRPEVQRDIWQKHQNAIKPLIKEAEVELEAMRKRFKRLREEAMQAPPITQDSLLSKLDHFEDRVYFAGEVIPLDVLDTELQFDVEDREIPPEDERRR